MKAADILPTIGQMVSAFLIGMLFAGAVLLILI
jgi:hypothetical protein